MESTLESMIAETVRQAVAEALREWKTQSLPPGLEGKTTITIKEAAEQLNISTALMYELAERADFPVIPLGGRRKVIPVDGLREWMKKRTQGGE